MREMDTWLSVSFSRCLYKYMHDLRLLSLLVPIYRPTYLSITQPIYLSICLSIYLSIYLSVYLSIYLSIY